jgi:hypothetical protein
MTNKKTAVLLTMATIAGAFLIFGPMQGDLAYGGDRDRCDCRHPVTIGGSWIISAPSLGLAMLETIIPIDQSGKRFALQAQNLNPNYTFNGMFPADYLSQFNGEAVRTGCNTVEGTMIAYSIKKAVPRDQILLIWVLHATSTFTEDTQVATGTFAAYLPNGNGDLIPDEGAVPIMCAGPIPVTANRIPIMALPCE